MRRFSKAVTSLVVVITLIIGLVAVGKSNVRAAGSTPEFLGEVVAQQGDIKDLEGYTPTQIRNGKFDVHPFMYIPKADGGYYFMEEIFDEIIKRTAWTSEQKSAWETAGFTWEPKTDPQRIEKMDEKNSAIRLEKGTSGNSFGNAYIVGPNESYNIDITNVLNSLGRTDSWRTTESHYQYESVRIKDYFEWINAYPSTNNNPSGLSGTYGSNINFASDNNPSKVDPCVELNKEDEATLYQDLGTTGRDIILWSLSHAGRSLGQNNMQVIIGPYTVDATTGGAFQSAMITEGYETIFTPSGVNPTALAADLGKNLSKQAGYYANLSDLAALELSNNVNWSEAKGIYIVPEGQTETRFAFQSRKGGGSMGNFLDDVVFDTLAGNLKSEMDSEGNITITGYWGALDDVSKELIYELFDGDDPVGTVLLNMKNVEKGPFKATITKSSLTDKDLNPEDLRGYLNKNDVIPKDYYSQVNAGAAGSLPLTVTFDTQKSGLKDPAMQFPKSDGSEKATSPSEYKEEEYYTDGTKLYKFEGWYKDPEATDKYNFNTLVKSDITLYAKWTEVTNPSLIFDLNDHPEASNPPAPQVSDGTTGWTGTKPSTNPSVSGFRFDGWYESENPGPSEKPYDFTKPVTDNPKTLYAKWTPKKSTPPSGGGYTPPSTIPTKTHKVEFETPVGPKPDTQSGIKSGQTAKDPTSFKIGDEIDGQIFEGWFKDPEFKVPYDFNEKVNEDIKVYAKWTAKETSTQIPTPEQKEVKIEFESEIGVTPETQVTTPGNTATDPGAPMNPETLKPGMIINGYRFEGWYLDKDFTIPYNFGMAVNEDIVLYAKWAAVGIAKSPKTSDATAYYWMALAAAGLITFFGRTALRSKKSK